MKTQSKEIRLSGVAASPGIAMGPILVLGSDTIFVEEQRINSKEIDLELDKFDKALDKSKKDLQKLYEKALVSYGDEAAQIFNVHTHLLEDPMIVDETIKKIRKDKCNSDYAFASIIDNYIQSLDEMSDELFKSRTTDLHDIKRRVIRYLQGDDPARLKQVDSPVIIFAKELTPSETIRLDRSKVLGFAMDFGARTSHATILARSIKVPAVVGLNQAGKYLKNGDSVILDGEEGLLIIHPNQSTLTQFQKRYSELQILEKRLEAIKKLPARTKDGKDIELASNIEFPQEVETIQDLQGDGVGLFRTEYLFLADEYEPTEEQQFQEYKNLLERLEGKPLIIRTYDLGGDKPSKSLIIPPEQNPFLGVRGVRLYRDSGHQLFRTQLRAIFRASVFGDIRVMFPMIACMSEIQYCRRIINEIKVELKRQKIEFSENVPIGAMIEVPSAAATADLIADECDFLSIGTNDLIQYSTAVDRGNENLGYLYQPYNPAVLRFIRDTIAMGHQKGVWVGMCGEMASDPLMTMVLIGLGLDEFSLSPVSHLLIKEIIRHVEYHECESMAQKALQFSTSDDVHNYLNNIYQKKFRHLLHLTH